MKLFKVAMLLLLAVLTPITLASAQTQIVGEYNSTPPLIQDGGRGNIQMGSRGSLNVTLVGQDSLTGVLSVPDNVDAVNPVSSSQRLGVRASNMVYNGTTWDRQRGDTNGIVAQPALSANYWSYAAASGGIVNTTTAVTIKAAAGASVRNYLCTLNISHDVLGAATEIAVRDGAAGTVIWRGRAQTAAVEGNSEVNFAPCLRGTANTLMEVVTLTAVTGGVYVNASGYTGS